MSTQYWQSIARFGNDTQFRQIGSTLTGKLDAVELEKTSDSGQINWTTVTSPVSMNSYVGYEIRKFKGSLGSTSPIFVKLEFGAASSATAFAIRATVGTGSNGSGTITGVASTSQILCSRGITIPLDGQTYPCYVCHTEGFFGMYLGANTNSGNASDNSLFISRTVDSAGVVTGRGAVVQGGAGSSTTGASAPTYWQNLRFEGTPTAYTSRATIGEASFCAVTGLTTNTSDDLSNKSVFMHMMLCPNPQPHNFLATVVASEIGIGTQFSTAIVGTTARNYIGLGPNAGRCEPTGSANYGLAMLWE